MLFYLTDSLIVDKEAPEFVSIKRSIWYLALSVAECKHLLRGDENVLAYYEHIFIGDEMAYPILHNLVVKPITANAIPNEIINYVEVVKENPIDTVNEGHRIKQVCYKYFNDSKKVQPMCLAVEDIDDSKFYDYILDWYLKENYLKFNHSFSVLPGGGGRTETNVNDRLNDGLMVTCIVDSDKKYKGQPDDPTSTGYKCSKIKCPKGGIYYFLMLAVHELENLIPLNHLNHLKWEGKGIKDKNDFMYLCGKTESEQILPYFDIKEGIKKKDIINLGANYFAFAEKCCSLHPILQGGKTFKDYVDGLPNDDSPVYPRLRKRIMNDMAELYEKRSVVYPSLMVFQFDEWNKIAQLLLDVTCAKNPEAMM